MRPQTSLLFTLVVCTSGCALLSKATPVEPRYFTPETAQLDAGPHGLPASHLEVHLGRVVGASFLKERMAYTNATHELGLYEELRWTERPEVYLERAVEHALFDSGRVTRALPAWAPTLTVDLIEFEEVKGDGGERVRLRLHYALSDARTVLGEGSFVTERPLSAGAEHSRPNRVAAALGQALDAASDRLAVGVVTALSARAPSR